MTAFESLLGTSLDGGKTKPPSPKSNAEEFQTLPPGVSLLSSLNQLREALESLAESQSRIERKLDALSKV
jgi:hypothetical protein